MIGWAECNFSLSNSSVHWRANLYQWSTMCETTGFKLSSQMSKHRIRIHLECVPPADFQQPERPMLRHTSLLMSHYPLICHPSVCVCMYVCVHLKKSPLLAASACSSSLDLFISLYLFNKPETYSSAVRPASLIVLIIESASEPVPAVHGRAT